MRPFSDPTEISVTVDDIKVSGYFNWPSTSAAWIEVVMLHPYRGSWLVRPCFHHLSPPQLILGCKVWTAKLKLELEYRKMKAIDDHYNSRPPWHLFGYPEI